MTAPSFLAALMAGDAPLSLDELFHRPDWTRDAACREHPEVDFFATTAAAIDRAKAICETCLVRDECAQYALEHNERDGVWGGLDVVDRRARRRGLAPPARRHPSTGTEGPPG